MKKAMTIKGKAFKKRKTFSSLFSEALAEGIRDTFKEMGYDLKDKKQGEDVFPSKKINTNGIAPKSVNSRGIIE